MLTAFPPNHRTHQPHPGPFANAAAVAVRHAAHKTDDPELERIADDTARSHQFNPAERTC